MRIVILAGGEGRRIGGGKPQRLLGGETLLDRALRHRAELVGRRAGRGRHGGDARPAIEGPLGGVAAALALGGDMLTIPCDMPFLPDDLPERLAERARRRRWPRAAAGCTRSAPSGSARAADGLAGLCSPPGRRSLHGFAEAVGYAAVEWARSRSIPSSTSTTRPIWRGPEALLRSR